MVPRKIVERHATQGPCSGSLDKDFLQDTPRHYSPTCSRILENRSISTYQEKEWNRNTPWISPGVAKLPTAISNGVAVENSTRGGGEPQKKPPASVWGEEEESELPEVSKVSWIKSEGSRLTKGRRCLLDLVFTSEIRHSIALSSHSGTVSNLFICCCRICARKLLTSLISCWQTSSWPSQKGRLHR